MASDFGDHVHRRLGSQIAKDPFHVTGGREPARTPRSIAHLQHRELHRRIDGDVHAKLGADAILAVLEDAVAEAVAGDIGAGAAGGQRRGRPELPGFLVAQEERFSACIAHGVVVPGRETKLVRVLAPRVRQPGFGNDRAEVRIRQHVDPGRRRRLARAQRDDVLAAVGRESPKPVGQDQLARGRFGRAAFRRDGSGSARGAGPAPPRGRDG